jgi:hypothetical protein
MDAMAAILMPGFKESNWTEQEVGIAIGRDRLVIPVIRGLDPYGFIGKYQGLRSDGKTVRHVARGIFGILGTSERTRNRLMSCLLALLLAATSEEDALNKLSFLTSLDAPKRTASHLRDGASRNELFLRSDALRAATNDILRANALPDLPRSLESDGEKGDLGDLPF